MNSNTFIKETKELTTILDFLRYGLTKASASNLYYGHGTDNAWDDIRSLILRSLSLPYDIDPLLLHSNLTQSEKDHLCLQLEKRINQRIPVPYLINEAYFCHMLFYVDNRVLIPRSPIAELIKTQFSPWVDADNVQYILDLCTGSGCIAIACCQSFPGAEVHAVDISTHALEVAELNSQRFNLEDQLTLIESDCFSNVPEIKYDIIVSNPPYVGEEEMQSLPDEYRHEPAMALETSQNGLAIVNQILTKAAHYLSDNGILVVEVGNSEDALVEAYPTIPFLWLDFEEGGQGVFLLTKQQLSEHFN